MELDPAFTTNVCADTSEWRFEFLDPGDLRGAVMQALGAASVCWENMSRTGVFQSERAVEIGEALLEFIAQFDGGDDRGAG